MVRQQNYPRYYGSFQFLGIPPKGELTKAPRFIPGCSFCFQFLGIPPKGELYYRTDDGWVIGETFPISRDPPEGGTEGILRHVSSKFVGFQFLGIPPKGEL